MRKGILTAAIALLAGVMASWFWPAGDVARTDPGYSGRSWRLAELLDDRADEGFARADAAHDFVFPEDHGPHPDFRNEWWYVTGNLDGDANERFGFELTIFRFALAPLHDDDPGASAWKTNQVFIGHFAITDVGNADFHVAQRHARGGLDLAGAKAEPLNVWVEDWFISTEGDEWTVRAGDETIAIDLVLRPLRPPVLNGVDGLSQKSSEPGNASYYYSIPRLETGGTLTIGNEKYAVNGLSWLDREWGSSGLSRDQQGWDWFSIQLSDGSDLMFYNLRMKDGNRDPHSAGTWTMPDGVSVHLQHDDVEIVVDEFWDSPAGGTYPMAWRLRVEQADLDLSLRPVLDAQELRTVVRYWEGAVDVIGRKSDTPVQGRGYVELTGYASR